MLTEPNGLILVITVYSGQLDDSRGELLQDRSWIDEWKITLDEKQYSYRTKGQEGEQRFFQRYFTD